MFTFNFTGTIEKWYTDWRMQFLNSNNYGNDIDKLKVALKFCQADEVEQILTLKNKLQ